MPKLAEASLTSAERRTLERLVELLRRELADDLHAVWLYGSRARGEQLGEGSDVDILVIGEDGERTQELATRLLGEAAEAEGVSPWSFSVLGWDLEWLANRRGIESFFVQEVERDKLVLAGGEDPLAGAQAPEVHGPSGFDGMSPRSAESMRLARESLSAARVLTRQGPATPSVHDSYYAMLYAARAALSERDRYAKTHGGTWNLFAEEFVRGGEFDPELLSRARAAQELRWKTDYDAVQVSMDDARALLADAERFVQSVAAMLD